MNLLNVEMVFAVPGEHSIIDIALPNGRAQLSGETLDEVRKRYPGAELMTWESWQEAEIKRQNTPLEWQEVTAERYHEMLEVLPPASMGRGAFLVGEPQDHDVKTGRPRYDAFKAVYGKFYVSSRPMTIFEFKGVMGIKS